MSRRRKSKRKTKSREKNIECTGCCQEYNPNKIVHSKYTHHLCQNCFDKFNGCFYCDPSISQKKPPPNNTELYYANYEHESDYEYERGYIPSQHLIPIDDMIEFIPIQIIRNHCMIHSIIIYVIFCGALLEYITNYFQITNMDLNINDIGDILRKNQHIICTLAIGCTIYKKIRNSLQNQFDNHFL